MNGAEVQVRAKLIRSPESAAVCVSEAIGHHVLSVIGIRVAECHAIHVSREFAEELTRQYSFEVPVQPGRHWGTTHLQNRGQEVEFTAGTVRRLAAPKELFTLYAGDLILGNDDRTTHGNVILVGAPDTRDMAILAIDQSDCFGHPSCFRDPDLLQRKTTERMARYLPGTEGAVLDEPIDFPRTEVARIQALEDTICHGVRVPPDEWYDKAQIDPSTAEAFLRARIRNLPNLIDLTHWENARAATEGGYQLGLDQSS